MKILLFIMTLMVNISVFGKESYTHKLIDESNKRYYKNIIDKTNSQLQTLFTKNKEELKILFPEFKIEDLVAKIKESKIEIVTDALIDKNGISRTCLNYPELSLIKCTLKELDKFFDYRESLYILMLHEFLGLIGIEETSSSQPNFSHGYLISNRLARYVTKTGAYDFAFDKSSLHGFEFSMEQRVLNHSLVKKSFGLNLKIVYPTEKELIKDALKLVQSDCENKRKKITFMDGHAFNVIKEKESCENIKHCISTSGTIFVRFICE